MKPIILYGPDGRELQTGVILGFHEPAKRRREDSRPEVDAIGYATVWPDEELEAIENRAASRDQVDQVAEDIEVSRDQDLTAFVALKLNRFFAQSLPGYQATAAFPAMGDDRQPLVELFDLGWIHLNRILT